MVDAVLVIGGGDKPSASTYRLMPDFDAVICADKGLEYAAAEGLGVDICVGDFDSVDQATLLEVKATGTSVVAHRADKDQTDLELALLAALDFNPSRVVVIGIGGGRLDHFFGNIVLLASPSFEAVEVNAIVDTAWVSVIHTSRVLRGAVGELVSFFAINGTAHRVSLQGFVYPLSEQTLKASSTLGLSNKFSDKEAFVTVGDGALIAVQPEWSVHTDRSNNGQ